MKLPSDCKLLSSLWIHFITSLVKKKKSGILEPLTDRSKSTVLWIVHNNASKGRMRGGSHLKFF